MPPILMILLENGSTIAEHATDVWPVIGVVVIILLSIIAWGINQLLNLLKERLDEFKTQIQGAVDKLTDHEVRITLLEREGENQS